MRTFKTAVAILAALSLSPLAGRAAPQRPQGGAGGDGQAKVKRLTERIAKQMRKIDELLNRAARTQPERTSAAKTGESEHSKVVDETLERSEDVVKAIDELLRISERQRSPNNGQPQDREPDRGQDQRDEAGRRPEDRAQNMPDYTRQRAEEPQREAKPTSPGGDDEAGRQRKGRKPPDLPTGKPQKAGGAGKWGFLPRYLQWLFREGGGPEVPAKYRRFADEFHKKADSGKNGRRR